MTVAEECEAFFEVPFAALFYLSVTNTYLLCRGYLQLLNSLYTVIVNT